MKKNLILTLGSFLIVSLFVLTSIGSGDTNDSSKTDSSKTETKSSSAEAKQACNGTQSCIERVRSNFQLSGKQILGEEYLGDGVFGISFLDPRRGESYNAKVFTDCNCEIKDVNVSVMR